MDHTPDLAPICDFFRNLLMELSEADLYTTLAIRVREAANASTTASKFDVPVDVDSFPKGSSFTRFGARVFRRWNGALYEFACKSNDEDKTYKSDCSGPSRARKGVGPRLLQEYWWQCSEYRPRLQQ
jgi:hypothetical protein